MCVGGGYSPSQTQQWYQALSYQQSSDPFKDAQYQRRLNEYVSCMAKREIERAKGGIYNMAGFCTAP